jgi:hypothetical protein
VAITPSGTAPDEHEIRDLIRRMSVANPLWGGPRTHGEVLKLGIEVSQATVERYLPWRPKVPSPTWRSFLHNHLTDIAALDMFVDATAPFRALSRCRKKYARNVRLAYFQATATAARHVFIADARKARCVLR